MVEMAEAVCNNYDAYADVSQRRGWPQDVNYLGHVPAKQDSTCCCLESAFLPPAD